MKFVEAKPFADPDATARKHVEIANGVEAVQDGRIYIERLNTFLAAGGSGEQFRTVIARAVALGDYDDRIIAEAGSQQLSVSGADTRAASAAPSRGRRRRPSRSPCCSCPGSRSRPLSRCRAPASATSSRAPSDAADSRHRTASDPARPAPDADPSGRTPDVGFRSSGRLLQRRESAQGVLQVDGAMPATAKTQ